MTVNDCLSFSILLVSLMRREWLVAGIMLATIAHSVLDHAVHMGGYSYYITASLVDATAVFAIARKSPVTNSIKFIQLCCLSFIAAHIFGFVWWYCYNPPLIYNTLCSIIYASMLANMIFTGGGIRVGGNKGRGGPVVSHTPVHRGS